MSKVIYIKVENNEELQSVLIPTGAREDEIKESFLALADLNNFNSKNVVLRLFQKEGGLIAIGPNLPQNTQQSSYNLEVEKMVDVNRLIEDENFNYDEEAEAVEKQLEVVMKKPVNFADVKEIRDSVINLKNQILELENAGILNSKFLPHNTFASKEKKNLVKKHFSTEVKYIFTEETKENLKRPQFDNWQWEENEIMSLLEFIFTDLGLMEDFNIDRKVLKRFLCAVKDNYHENMYGIINVTGLVHRLKPIDKLILTVSCIGHAMLFTILKLNETNILKNVPDSVYRDVRKGIIKCILSTDMVKHGEIMGQFKKIVDNFNYDDVEHKTMLLQMITKCADISNEEPWVDCLLEEFFTQSDREKAEGLPSAPFMDREKVTKSSAQIGFIGFVMIPLFEMVGKLLPLLDDNVILPIRRSLAYYKEMQEKMSNMNSTTK
ncbi:High affinity cAMP-specific and IBMX-insensitive 3',5'-cyclic phosphodiesterase 9A [Clydaea vesicula]|uniref:High affinity cAMP-specific and IBMX-insensitive 3',5'-cyclic phosphodiesterase 9A n=1 Tax=Clydaea vesicula TaxID=447962 RepID=A0AAD5U6R0_9FUNG|nr:High affinity cAMP-specific and IBMX-insensitive 3',5'-cyclic phosphodiesterase 9A [Clydaea vesicula]